MNALLTALVVVEKQSLDLLNAIVVELMMDMSNDESAESGAAKSSQLQACAGSRRASKFDC